ncbi:hypothetical protein E7T09_07715 [Deinococcus sp. KSM4-11]|uniref:hypothetical protein n=1 Tax=Deinococcus sp. KSM4-11 TaxID=2568654 RepID=UPI0010A39936|nr:hypothetical protein [Deinococcus sp. KSM4-11]THF87050.1 hypothetical protein E7T09_07715 [Deinococcus sp. KSM4-11]
MTGVTAGPERRSLEPLAQLSRQIDSACVGAVQPLELAAILEAEGLTDKVVRERYGQDSVFECAQLLYAMVPHRASPKPFVVPGPQSPSWQNLLRGVIYLLPALWTPHALAVSGGVYEGAGLGLLVATLFGWGWMQGMAYLGYVVLSSNQVEAHRRLRAVGLGAAAFSVLVAAALATAVHQDVPQVMLATAGISLYLAAATTLLVLGREAALLLSALPALAWMAAQLRWPGLVPGGPTSLLFIAVAVPAGFAALPPRAEPRHAGRLPGLSWRAATPHMLYGWLCAACMSLVLLDPFHTRPAGELLGASWSVAPLILSLGLMELQLRHLHAGLRRQSRLMSSLRRIVWRAAGEVGLRCSQYVLVLGAAYAVVGWLVPRLGMTALPAPLLLGHVLMGLALMFSGLLINFAQLRWVLGVWGVALGTQLTQLLHGQDATQAYALGAGVASVLLFFLSALAVRDVRHLG